MFSSIKHLTGTALALIILASPAIAADINAEGATQLKTLIQSSLDLRKNIQSTAGGQYMMEGDLKVEPADGYYAVTFPHIKVKDISGKIVDFGMVAANVIPGDKPSEWKAAFALPTPVRLTGADGKSAGQIDIGGQKAVGIWDTELNSFSRLDATYNNVAYVDGAQSLTTQIGSISVKNQMTYTENGNVSGPFSVSADDWAISSPIDSTTAKLKNLRFDGTIKDYDPKIGKAVQDQMNALGQSGFNLADVNNPAASAHGSGLYKMLTELFTKSSDAFSVRMSLSDFKLDTLNPQTGKGDGMTLNYAGLGFAMSGFREGSVETGLQVKYDGLKLEDKTDPENDLLPESVNLDLAVKKLPLTQLLDLGRTVVEANQEASGMAGMQAMMTVPKLLTDAGTHLTHSFDFTSPIYKSKGSGVVNADIKAVMGYTAEQSMELEGLDKVIALVSERANDPANPAAENLKGLLGSLTVLQMAGQKDEKNPDLRTYKLVIDQQGRSMLNGSDMSALLGGPAAAAPAETPAPAPETPSGAQ